MMFTYRPFTYRPFTYRPFTYRQAFQCEQGTTLIIAMVFLLMMTLFGVGTMGTSNLNLLMANNEQLRIEAIQRSQSLIDSMINESENLAVVGGVGYTICAVSHVSSDCDISSIALPSMITAVDSGETIDYRAIRKGPETSAAPAFGEDDASSASFYKVAFYELQASYDGANLSRGRSQIAQGLMILIPDS
jgi:hypothetical protein